MYLAKPGGWPTGVIRDILYYIIYYASLVHLNIFEEYNQQHTHTQTTITVFVIIIIVPNTNIPREYHKF